MHFFMPLNPPTATHQMKKVRVVKGKPQFYEPTEVAQARDKLRAALAPHRPGTPLLGPVRLLTKWCFPSTLDHQNGAYRAIRPDTDNLQKLIKDVMTDLGFWKDDAQVASETVEKFWADLSGIYIEVEQLRSTQHDA